MIGKREKEYTPEEALALTMLEQTPRWFGATPLVVGVNLPGKSYPQPLDRSVIEGTWAFFFTSATGAEFLETLKNFRSWSKRYRSLGVHFIFSFRGDYEYFKERKSIEMWLRELNLGSPAVWDADGELVRSFSLKSDSGLAILDGGKLAYQGTNLAEGEKQLHALLRVSSPGLPLWPVAEPAELARRTTDEWRLHFGSEPIKMGQVALSGAWNFDEDRITTSDSKAEILFTAPDENVILVARSLSEIGDPTRVRFDTNGASFSGDFGGPDLSVDDEGHSAVVLAGPRAYSVLQKLPPALRQLRFQFPFAKVNPVAVYGFEFGGN